MSCSKLMETTNDLLIDDTQMSLFRKMLDLNLYPAKVKRIMSFWMFLESKGFENIFENLLVANNDCFLSVCAEAEIVLEFLERENDQLLKPRSPSSASSTIFCPHTWVFAGSDLSPTDVLGDKEKVFNETSTFYHDVYSMAFDDILVEKGYKASKESFKLNPMAPEFNPPESTEDERSLFMTFSKGRPLTKHEIIHHFRSLHGDCVENVLIHTPRGRFPEFGKIIFKYSWIPNHLLQKADSVIIRIGKKTIGLKRYNLS